MKSLNGLFFFANAWAFLKCRAIRSSSLFFKDINAFPATEFTTCWFEADSIVEALTWLGAFSWSFIVESFKLELPDMKACDFSFNTLGSVIEFLCLMHKSQYILLASKRNQSLPFFQLSRKTLLVWELSWTSTHDDADDIDLLGAEVEGVGGLAFVDLFTNCDLFVGCPLSRSSSGAVFRLRYFNMISRVLAVDKYVCMESTWDSR